MYFLITLIIKLFYNTITTYIYIKYDNTTFILYKILF